MPWAQITRRVHIDCCPGHCGQAWLHFAVRILRKTGNRECGDKQNATLQLFMEFDMKTDYRGWGYCSLGRMLV